MEWKGKAYSGIWKFNLVANVTCVAVTGRKRTWSNALFGSCGLLLDHNCPGYPMPMGRNTKYGIGPNVRFLPVTATCNIIIHEYIIVISVQRIQWQIPSSNSPYAELSSI